MTSIAPEDICKMAPVLSRDISRARRQAQETAPYQQDAWLVFRDETRTTSELSIKPRDIIRERITLQKYYHPTAGS